MLRFYVNKRLISANASVIPLLFPFFGQVFKERMLYWNEVFVKHGFDRKHYSLVEKPRDADAVLLPHHYGFLAQSDPERLNSAVSEAVKASKPIVVEATGDFSGEVEIPRVIIIRSWRDRSLLKNNDIVMPAYSEDLLDQYDPGQMNPRLRRNKPVIGFTGWGKIEPLRFPLLFLKYMGNCVFNKNDNRQNGIFIRSRAVSFLTKYPRIRTNFILRPSYSGHRDTISVDSETARREFVENINESDYTLCVRGESNYSIRFFETLSMGRLPLYVDTEGVLPLEDLIDYRDIIVAVKLAELSNIGVLVDEFHRKITKREFECRQRLARKVYEKFLRLDSYTPYLMTEIRKRFRS